MAEPTVAELEAARQRLAVAQTALLSALTAGSPLPEGFDRTRLRIQREALAAKRAQVLAKVMPELPAILGTRYHALALAYIRSRPLTGGYRQDAIAFAREILASRQVTDKPTRRHLERWLRGTLTPRNLR